MYIRRYGGLDVLVNNAAKAFKGDATEPFAVQAEETIKLNYWGTKTVCQHLFPLLRSGARVVNMSSMAGWLKEMMDDDTEVKNILSQDDLKAEQIDQLMRDFVASAKSGKQSDKGWPDNTYITSKVGVSALSVAQQRVFDQDKEKDVVVNHVHPGLMKSGMGGRGNRTTEEGAKTPIFAAMLPPKTDIRGQYIWEDGTVFAWKGKREFSNMKDMMAKYYPQLI